MTSPHWVKLTPTIAMLIGLWIAWNNYIRDPAAPAASSRTFPGVYRFSANKWYFDELYDLIFVRPALWLGRLFWKGGDEGTIDRFGPHGAAYAVGVGNRVTARLPVGLPLYLRAGDAARPDRRGELGDLVGAMTGFPLLTILIAVPLIGGVRCLFAERERRALDRAGRDPRRPRARHLPLGRPTIPTAPQWQFVEKLSRSAAASPGRSASTASR